MATVTAYDPRDTIRTTIGTAKYVKGLGDVYVISVTNNYGDDIDVPLLKPLEIMDKNPKLPYINMKLMSSPARTMNIGGDIHRSEAYLDFDITFVATTLGVDDEFGHDVASEIVDKIMDNRSSVGMFIEVINDGREWYEGVDNLGVVFHRLLELRTWEMQKK